VAGASTLHAQETLYGKQPPPGSAYVRFANALDSGVTVKTNYQPDTHLGMSPANRVGAFSIIENAKDRPLDITVQDGHGASELHYAATAEAFVTFVFQRSDSGTITISPISERVDFNQMRARIAFYNAVPGCAAAALTIRPSGPEMFQGVVNATVQSRTVKPVKASVQTLCAGHEGPSLDLDGLETGASYSLWLTSLSQNDGFFLTRDAVTPYAPGK
jgi:hypothetical protein